MAGWGDAADAIAAELQAEVSVDHLAGIGWADASDAADVSPLESCAQYSQLPLSVVHQRGRGRPSGNFGSHAFRQHLHDLEAAASSQIDAAAPPLPGSIEYARSFKRQRIEQPASLLEVAERSPSFLSTAAAAGKHRFGQLSVLSRMTSTVIQRLILCCALAFQSRADNDHRPDETGAAINYLFRAGRPAMSSTASAVVADTTRFTMQRSSVRVASALVESGGFLWGGMLTQLKHSIDAGILEGHLIAIARKYDETPTKVRINDQGDPLDPLGAGHCRIGDDKGVVRHAKVMQTQLQVGAVVRHIATNQFLLITGNVPCNLQVVDRTTAETTKYCILDHQSRISNLEEVATSFKMKAQLSCADRFSGNTKAESSIKKDGPLWAHSSLPCDCHKVFGTNKNTFDLTKAHVSGLLSFALCMGDGGSVWRLRKILDGIWDDKLQIIYAEPPTGRAYEYRQEVYDLFLQTRPGHDQKKARRLKPLKQRYILGCLLNGELELPEPTHYCPYGCCKDRGETLYKFKKFATPALIPCKCALVARHHWTGLDDGLDWTGLFGCHHGLLGTVLMMYTGTVPKQPSASVCDIVGWDIPDAVCDDELDGGDQQPVHVAASDDIQEPTLTSAVDWVAFNKAVKTKAGDFAATQPWDIFVLMRLVHVPLGRLLHSFLQLTGTSWVLIFVSP
jgi:hypothetical protein